MNASGLISTEGELSARLIRADGTSRDAVLSTEKRDINPLLLKPKSFIKNLFDKLRLSKVIPLGMTLAAFYEALHGHGDMGLALVTTTGVNYLALDFLTASSSRINAFNYHDSGTGTTSAVIGDSALQTQAGPTTRATGTQSTPTSGQYRSVGTISYVSTLAVTEWGLFSQAAQGGTMWDHRVFSAINVVSGDSIAFTYTLTVNAGGS